MQSIISKLSKIIDESPNIATAMQIITNYIKIEYPMNINGYDDDINAEITTHWQNIIFGSVIFGSDYIAQVNDDEDADPIARNGAQRMEKNPATWYDWDYKSITKSELKSIVKSEFSTILDKDDCTNDWAEVDVTDTLNDELSLHE